jgi:hypothetical protein
MTLRCSCVIVSLLAGFAAACTSPIESDSLPTVDPPPARVLRYRSVPDMPEQRPPLLALSLLATSPDHPRWAVSDGRRLWIADDEGPLVEQRRDYRTRLQAMAVDHEGRLWLLDDRERLARLDADGHAEQLSPPVEHIDAVVVGAKHVVLLGMLPEGAELPPSEPGRGLYDEGQLFLDEQFVLAISDDGGHEWRLRRRPVNYSEHDDLLIAPDGSMQLMDGNEASCGGGFQERWISHVDRPGWKQLDWPIDAAFDRYAGAGGWSYGFEEGFRAIGRDGADYLLNPATTRYAFVHDGRAGVLLTGEGMWSVDGRKATRIGDLAPELRDVWDRRDFFVDALAIAHDGALLLTHAQSIIISAPAEWRSINID